MMGNTGVSDIPRYKSGRVDVAILQSKTGHAILKGGQFYTKALTKQLKQLKKDVSVELSMINYQMKLLVTRRNLRMRRSEQLNKNYDLPPISSPIRANVTQTVSPGVNRKLTAPVQGRRSNLNDRRSPKKQDKLLERRHQRQEHEDEEEQHRSIFSPAPMKYVLDDEEERTQTAEDDPTYHQGLKAYPHITVQTCEEKLPPLQREPSPPLYLSNSRPGSTQSLEIPSPVLQRRSKDGKDIIVLSPGNLSTAQSRSESSLHNVLEDPRFKALEAVLRPVTSYRSQARPPKRTTIDTNTYRTMSRSVSPRPRITNRAECSRTGVGSSPLPKWK